METYNDIYLRVRKALRGAGIEGADMEAKFIVAGAMGRSREELLAMNKIYATDEKVRNRIDDWLDRRICGEPLAYILGKWEFYGLNLDVNKNVLIPRADTELLTTITVKTLQAKMWKSRVLDLCAGSGCIGLAIASKVASSHVVMADISEDVLAVCRQNTISCSLTRNTTIALADALKEPPTLFGAFDVMVSNPPYIPTKDIEDLDVSVRDYEPHSALDGGEDGLKFFRSISKNWSRLLKPGGNLAFEVGIGQMDEVHDIMKENAFTNLKTHKDTQGIERVIIGMKG